MRRSVFGPNLCCLLANVVICSPAIFYAAASFLEQGEKKKFFSPHQKGCKLSINQKEFLLSILSKRSF